MICKVLIRKQRKQIIRNHDLYCWQEYNEKRIQNRLTEIEVEYCKIKWCGCGDELRSEEDLKTKTCWICRSVGRNDKNKTDI